MEPAQSNKDEILREKSKGPWAGASGQTRLIDTPCIFVDKLGHIVATYLPGCFLRRRSVSVGISALSFLGLIRRQKQILEAVKQASQYPNSVIRIQKSDSWRDERSSYANPSKCLISPGLANLSICWFQQGHGVSCRASNAYFYLIFSTPAAQLNPSSICIVVPNPSEPGWRQSTHAAYGNQRIDRGRARDHTPRPLRLPA